MNAKLTGQWTSATRIKMGVQSKADLCISEVGVDGVDRLLDVLGRIADRGEIDHGVTGSEVGLDLVQIQVRERLGSRSGLRPVRAQVKV